MGEDAHPCSCLGGVPCGIVEDVAVTGNTGTLPRPRRRLCERWTLTLGARRGGPELPFTSSGAAPVGWPWHQAQNHRLRTTALRGCMRHGSPPSHAYVTWERNICRETIPVTVGEGSGRIARSGTPGAGPKRVAAVSGSGATLSTSCGAGWDPSAEELHKQCST